MNILTETASLVWHRFFVPNLPTLVSLRERLTSDESSTNCATRLLFALLAVAACEANVNVSREEWRLRRNLQMAVSFYGQEFMFSPPTHLDSVIVSLYLSDYKPAALATMQGVAHKTIKSEMYINIAYGVFHRLEAVAGEGNQDLGALNSPDYREFEQCLLNSILGVQMVSNHATVDGPIKKPLQSLRHLASYMKTRVDAYQSALNTRQCSPRAIYHIQWAVSTYILFHSFANAKESMNDPRGFIRIAEEAETNCREQINYTYTLLELCSSQNYDEIAAVRGLVELRFNTVLNWIIALGFLYTSSLGARSEEGRSRRNSDITCEETIQITSQIVKTWNGPLDQTNQCFREYMIRFGIQYTTQLSIMMSKFIECSKMPLNGVEFRPPPRHICLENVTCCKNILENNVIQIKAFGRLHPDFENQIELVKTCAERLANMASSPTLSVDAAFAGGCVYAMSSKIIFGFLSLMEKLKNNFSTGKANVDLVDQIIASAEYSGLPGVDSDQISDEGDFWPSVGTFGQLDALSDPFDWSSMLEPDYVQQVGFGQEGQDWFNDPFL